MSRRDDERLADVLASAEAIGSHLERGGLDDGLVFDAVRVRLIEIGEAVKDIDPALLATEPDIPWRDVAGMRDHVAHRYQFQEVLEGSDNILVVEQSGRRSNPLPRTRKGSNLRLLVEVSGQSSNHDAWLNLASAVDRTPRSG